MKCGICNAVLLDSQLQWELDCKKHLGHASHESYDCTQCGFKDGQKVAPSQQEQRKEPSEAERRKQMSALRVNEPLGNGGGGGGGGAEPASFVGNMWSAVTSRLAPLFSRTGEALENLPPKELLAQRIPLKDMVSKYGYDITELINDHKLNINDFFEQGYTVAEMIDAFPSRMNQKDGMAVMSHLGIQAEHFRCVPELVCADVMAKKIGYKPSDLVDRFDLKYKSPVSEPRSAWSLQELVDNGLVLSDMQRAGLVCEVQWKELTQTVAPIVLPELAKKFGATPEVIASELVSASVTEQLSTSYAERQRAQQAYLEQERSRQELILREAIRHHSHQQGLNNNSAFSVAAPGQTTGNGAPVLLGGGPRAPVAAAPAPAQFHPQLFLSKDPLKFAAMAPSIDSPASFKFAK